MNFKLILIGLLLVLFSTPIFALSDANLVAWYNFDETTGTNVIDVKDYDNNGTNTNVTINQIGKVNKAYSFNGSNSTVYSNNESDFDFLTANNASFTFSFWAKYGNITAYSAFFTKTNNNSTDGISFRVDNGSGTGSTGWVLLMYTGVPTPHNRLLFYESNSGTNDNQWHHFAGTCANNDCNIYIDGNKRTHTTSHLGSYSGVNNSYNLNIGSINNAGSFFSGLIDEIGFFNRTLTSTEITELYNSGVGITYPFYGAGFSYVINKNEAKIYLTDTSTFPIITGWNWLKDGISFSTDQNTSFTATQLTDYNICLIVDTNTTDVSNTKCYSFNTGDWSPPTTTFSSSQIAGTTDQNITLTCTDNNSGCEYINFRINNGDWNYYLIGDNPLNIIYSGTGLNSIQYFSTDNSDNNETIKTSTFKTYGKGRFTFYDENSLNLLNSINYTITPSINGVSSGTTDGNTLNLNLQGITTGTYLFTLTKTGYSTRYYQTDLNEFSDFDTNFALIQNTIDVDIPFKVYKTDETTIYTNTFVELKDKDTNYTIGKLKTNTSGETTFNLRTDDSNYWTIVNNGEFTYSPITLTVLYPKNEETLAQITETWKISITQNLYASYNNLNATKIVYLLPNTSNPYNIKVSDTNGNYFPRTYAKIYPGNPLTDTLQPYLIDTTTGLLTTIRTVNAYNNQPVTDITIKIYKYISDLGRTYVEQVVTDAKGEALTYAVLGSEYEYEIYDGTTLLRTDKITASSNIVYIRIADTIYTEPVFDDFSIVTSFNPTNQSLYSYNNQLIQTINFKDYNSTDTISKIYVKVLNTDVNGIDGNNIYVYSNSFDYNGDDIINTIDLNSTAQTLDGNWYDTNGYLKVEVIITINGVNYTDFIYYKPYTQKTAIEVIGIGSRTFWGCTGTDPNIPCPNQLFVALFISFIITAGVAVGLNAYNPTGLGITFLLLLGVFTWFTYIPILVYGLLVAGGIVIIFAARGRFL